MNPSSPTEGLPDMNPDEIQRNLMLQESLAQLKITLQHAEKNLELAKTDGLFATNYPEYEKLENLISELKKTLAEYN